MLLDYEIIINELQKKMVTDGRGKPGKFQDGIREVKKLLDQSLFDDFRKSERFYDAVKMMDLEIHAAITFIKAKKLP
ncbi:MAG: hypothetical protein JWQ27_2340 [Ferruginibacter sp.]|nr:hypothetical protein [Ferruginibacter sp.]